MSNITPPPKGKVRIYANGGAAINIMAGIDNLQISPDMLADFEIVQIDTSHSNVTGRSANVENYLLPKIANVDGGGKDRTENRALIQEHIKPILKAHPPRDLNIILSTGSGSSGSVAATELTNELLTRGENVVVLTIGTTGSRKEAINTKETLTNYEQIAPLRKAPIVLHYLQNSPSMPRDKVNENMLSTISYLAILFSRRNTGMDKMDLYNWLHFTRPEVAKGLANQVYSLTVLIREFGDKGEAAFTNDLDKLGNILSVATLAKEGGTTEMPDDYMPEYHTEGFVPAIKDSKIFEGKSVNFIISDGLVNEISADLREVIKREKPQVQRSSLLSDKDDEDSDTSVNFS